MREIKFRAWIKNLYGEEPRMQEDVFSNYARQPLNEFIKTCQEQGIELMQFTGLKDKNGKDIYEGDIIEFFYKSDKKEEKQINKFRVEVVWKDFCKKGDLDVGAHHIGFMIFWNQEDEKDKEYQYSDFPRQEWCEIEVIGNKFENPELLEGGKNA